MKGDATKEETPVPVTATSDGRGSSGVNAQRYEDPGSGASLGSVNIEMIKSTLSEERFAPYVKDGVDDRKGLARYSLNIALSQALYPSIHCLEVALRNAIHRELMNATSSDTWFDTLPMLTDKQRKDVTDAREKLKRPGSSVTITSGQVVAELSLGFWTAFFNKRNARDVMSGQLVKRVFKHAPKRVRSLQHVDNQLTKFRILRNRVFHHERIIHWGEDLDKRHAQVIEVIRWICPHLAQVALKHDSYQRVRKDGLQPWLL